MIEYILLGFVFLVVMFVGSWLAEKAFGSGRFAFFAIAAFLYWSVVFGFVFYAIDQSSEPVGDCSGITNQVEFLE